MHVWPPTLTSVGFMHTMNRADALNLVADLQHKLLNDKQHDQADVDVDPAAPAMTIIDDEDPRLRVLAALHRMEQQEPQAWHRVKTRKTEDLLSLMDYLPGVNLFPVLAALKTETRLELNTTTDDPLAVRLTPHGRLAAMHAFEDLNVGGK